MTRSACPRAVQTEARLIRKETSDGKQQLVADANYLPYLW